jgi:ubiquitin-protein ligase
VKVTAGRIIPALATTTAMVCGLVDIEFCKLVLGLQNLGASKFFNSNINLATGLEAFSVFNPSKPIEQKTGLPVYDTFTSWDKLDYEEAGQSVQEIIARLQQDFGVVTRELMAETNYKPAKSVSLWKQGQSKSRLLSDLFREKLALGEEQADRSPEGKKRAKAELKRLQTDKIEGVLSVGVKGDDDFCFQLKLSGPPGSPYQGGTFLVEVKLPLEYPNAPPSLAVLTPIEHCNILDGSPCPNLLSLSPNQWSSAMTVHSVIMQFTQLLKEQSRGDALVPALAALDEAAFAAKAQESVKKYATADQDFPPIAVKMATDETEAVQWPHDYLILKGDFESCAGEDAALPRMKLRFGGAAKAKAAAAVMPVADDVRARVMAMALDVDGEALKPLDCYKLQPERVAIFGSIAEGLTADNAVAVTCSSESMGTVEAIINVDTMEHCKFEDPIMMTEGLIATLIEAQFEQGGPWVLSRGTVEGYEQEKQILFKNYEDFITKDPPECLSTLRKMMQNGPINRLYTGGGNKFVKSHEGFALRMPASEVADWQMTNDKGELQDIPRPAIGIRVWNAETRSYDSLDPLLNGAPNTPEAVDAWYENVVRKHKSSNYMGSDLVDALVTSKKTVSMKELESRNLDGAFEGKFSNHWTDLCLRCKPSTSGSRD